MAIDPSWVAATSFGAPPRVPIAVRTGSAMTTVCLAFIERPPVEIRRLLDFDLLENGEANSGRGRRARSVPIADR